MIFKLKYRSLQILQSLQTMALSPWVTDDMFTSIYRTLQRIL